MTGKNRVTINSLDKVIECECNGNGVACGPCSLRVKIQLPETEVENCDGTTQIVEALPVAPMGVQKVEICNPTPDIENITYCNKDTDTQWLRREITTFDTDGVPTTAVLSEIDLGTSCTDPTPDIEEVKLCINGTEQIQFYRFITNEDQSATTRELIDTVDTGIACNETRDVDVLTSCDGTTKSVEVKDSVATQVVFDEEQTLKVAIDKSCDPAPVSRDVEIETDCLGTLETVAVKDEFATEVVLSPNQAIKVVVDKSCDAVVTSDIITDCAGTTSTETVDSRVSLVGSENPIEVRIKEDCTTDPIKTIVTSLDCTGTTASVDTTKTVEAVINQVVFTKQCTKEESISEIQVCAGTDTLIKKTVIDSEGTETITFYGDDGVVATPTAYKIGACVIPVPDVDVEFKSGCSSIDGRLIFAKIVHDKLTNTEVVTLLENDFLTVVTDSSNLVKCSGADYELATETCMENTTTGDKYTVQTYINPVDITDFYKVWIDSNGDVVTAPSGVTACVSTCDVDMQFERCFDTGAGVVSVSGYYIKSAAFIETYQSARVIGSTDPAYSIGDNVISEVWLSPANEVTCSPSTEIVDRVTTHSRTSGTNTYSAPFRSFSVTAFGTNVTLNGQAMPANFTVSLNSEEEEQHITDQIVTGSDYFVTYVI